MQSEWINTTIGEFSPFSYGKSLPERERQPGLYPVISSAGISGSHFQPLVMKPGIVIGRKGTVGSITLSDKPFWPIDTTFYVLDEPEKRDLRFTYYLLKTLGLSLMNSDSAVPGLNRDNAHTLTVDIPPLRIQQSISSILGSLDEQIELNRQISKTLETLSQALFKSWFIDFDPVKAKMDGRPPEAMDEATAALFPAELQESEIGLIPKGWHIKRNSELLELAYGKALKATSRVPGEIPVYGSGGITGFHNKYLIEGPSVIVGRKGTVGSLYWEDRPFFPIDTVFYVKPKSTPLTFCYELLKTKRLNHMNTDAAVPGLNRENVYRLESVVPPIDILNAFDHITASIRQMIFANLNEAQRLTEIRDALLPKLMSGQLRIPIEHEKIKN